MNNIAIEKIKYKKEKQTRGGSPKLEVLTQRFWPIKALIH